MICPKCGSECDDNQMFCTKCGTKIRTFSDNISNSEKYIEMEKPFENIIGGLSLEEEEDDEMKRYLSQDLNANKHKTEKMKSEMRSESHSEGRNPKKAAKTVYKSNDKSVPYRKTKRGSNKKKIVLIVFGAIIAVVIAVFSTLYVKSTTMTKKFDRYYKLGSQYYDSQNYKDAKTQFINASNNAFFDSQKIKAYEMVYKVDEIIGGYAEEEMKYLESLIDLDDSNVEYYKALIILYQNNDLNNKIEPLIASAPVNIRDELKNFDGTIPTASEKEGTHNKPIKVELSASGDVTIYYTLDGSSVSNSSTKKQYKTPIKLEDEGNYTIKALSVDKNGKESKEMTIKYLLDFGSVNPPSVNLDSGKYTDQKKIEVTADPGCEIYYTTDGVTPTKKSTKYKQPIKLPKGDSLYYFIAVDADGVCSNVVTRAYDYSPEYNYSYDEALSTLTTNLVSKNILENKYGEFENEDLAYFKYNETKEIDDDFYYIVTCAIEDKEGKIKSTSLYAISCENGECYKAKSNGESYSLGSIE